MTVLRTLRNVKTKFTFHFYRLRFLLLQYMTTVWRNVIHSQTIFYMPKPRSNSRVPICNTYCHFFLKLKHSTVFHTQKWFTEPCFIKHTKTVYFHNPKNQNFLSFRIQTEINNFNITVFGYDRKLTRIPNTNTYYPKPFS